MVRRVRGARARHQQAHHARSGRRPTAAPDDTSIRPFRAHVSNDALDDLRRRLRATRWPDAETVSDASQGAQLANLQALVRYWLTNIAASAARIYWENRDVALTSATAQRADEIKVPVAITVFPDEVIRVQERWARSAFPTLSYFHQANRGGHFAAWEYPELFAAELRAAFKPLR